MSRNFKHAKHTMRNGAWWGSQNKTKRPRAHRKEKRADPDLAPKHEDMDGKLPRSTGGEGGTCATACKNHAPKWRWGKKKGLRRARRRIDRAVERAAMEGV